MRLEFFYDISPGDQCVVAMHVCSMEKSGRGREGRERERCVLLYEYVIQFFNCFFFFFLGEYRNLRSHITCSC